MKTDLYCYVTEKSGILGLKKLKECESSSSRHKRSVIIDDRIEQGQLRALFYPLEYLN